jgi:hypothetical protein
VGRAAAAAIELRGRCLIAGVLRTAIKGHRRPLYRHAYAGFGHSLENLEFLPMQLLKPGIRFFGHWATSPSTESNRCRQSKVE